MTMDPQMAIEHVLHDLPSAATATFLALFPIVNPLGRIPMFFSLTAEFPPEERRRTALKTALYVIAILVVFMIFGRFVLNFFGISLPVLKIAGGLIVANTAWGMMTGSSRMTTAESSEALTKKDISLTPMAMPMLSGPGSIGVVMGLAAHADHFLSYPGMVIGIVALGLTVYYSRAWEVHSSSALAPAPWARSAAFSDSSSWQLRCSWCGTAQPTFEVNHERAGRPPLRPFLLLNFEGDNYK